MDYHGNATSYIIAYRRTLTTGALNAIHEWGWRVNFDERWTVPQEYTALIRTFNSEKRLPHTLRSLERQTRPPSKYVFVDSGSTDSTLKRIPDRSLVHKYKSDRFNYSDSLNAGIAYIDTPYTMIISSHTSIANEMALNYALNLLSNSDDIAAAYFIQVYSSELKFTKIGTSNFSGFNGVWNTCAIYKTSLLKRRNFRTDVFSAEDQEWSGWLFKYERKYVAQIAGGGMSYNNPSFNYIKKSLAERLAVAIYVKKEMQELPYLLRLFYRVLRPVSNIDERIINAKLLCSLLCYRFKGKAYLARLQ